MYYLFPSLFNNSMNALHRPQDVLMCGRNEHSPIGAQHEWWKLMWDDNYCGRMCYHTHIFFNLNLRELLHFLVYIYRLV